MICCFENIGSSVLVTFGLNALYGRYQMKKGVWGGNWDSSNAYQFMKYTVSKGYSIDSWELGKFQSFILNSFVALLN